MEPKGEEDLSEEAFNAGAFARLFSGPGVWQSGGVLLSFGIPLDDRDGSQCEKYPDDEP